MQKFFTNTTLSSWSSSVGKGKLALFLLAFMFMTVSSFAQEKQVTGTVIDFTNDEPIVGASIQVKGTTRGTVSGVDGSFSLKASEGEVLVISFIGYVAIGFGFIFLNK